jgi:hypothetical protein
MFEDILGKEEKPKLKGKIKKSKKKRKIHVPAEVCEQCGNILDECDCPIAI